MHAAPATTPVPAERIAAARVSSVRGSVELLLALSFLVTVVAAGYGAAVGRTQVVTPFAAVVFLVTLTCVAVSWFRAVETDDRRSL